MVYFFGYGAYRDKKRLEDILQKEITGGYGAVLSDFVLAIQNLNLIPEKARKNIEPVWKEKFRAYTIKKGGGLVAGVLWEIDEKELQILKEWEYEGIWREFVQIEVTTYDKRKITAITEKIADDAPISEIVDGLHYDDNLNKQGKLASEDVDYKISETRELLKQLEKEAKHQ